MSKLTRQNKLKDGRASFPPEKFGEPRNGYGPAIDWEQNRNHDGPYWAEISIKSEPWAGFDFDGGTLDDAFLFIMDWINNEGVNQITKIEMHRETENEDLITIFDWEVEEA